MPYKINGKPFNPFSAFTTENGTQYPANWFQSATQDQRNALGITEYTQQPMPNQTYYWVTENPDGTYTTTEKDIEQFKPDLINKAWQLFQEKFYSSIITVQTSVGQYQFQCNQDTIENINSINTMISRNLPVPNPRPYTPKGQTQAVNFTHDDFGIIGLQLALNKDLYFQSYANHKIAITQLTQNDFETLINYDLTKNWPDSQESSLDQIKQDKITSLTTEKNNLIAQFSEPYDAAETIYIEMIETQLTETISQINNSQSEEEINTITIQWIQFGV